MSTAMPNVKFGKITGKFFKVLGDGIDPDRYPDGIPEQDLTIEFKTSVKRWKSLVNQAFYYPEPVIAYTNSQGVLVDAEGNAGIYLIATDQPGDVLNPREATWTCTIRRERTVLEAFNFLVPSDSEVDLSQVAPVTASGGVQIISGPRGDRGDKGDKGDPGGAAPEDVAIALSDLGSPAREVLNVAVAEQVAEDETVALAAAAAVGAAIKEERPSTNLYNPTDSGVRVGYTLNTTGGESVSATYTVTGHIPVTPSAKITVSNCRNYEYRAADGSFLAGSFAQNAGNGTITLTVPSGAAFFRCSFLHGSYADFRVNSGDALLPYEPFGTVVAINAEFAQAVGEAMPPPSIGHIAVARTGPTVTITQNLGGKALAQSLTLSTGRNARPNLTGVTYDGATVHVQADEITPIRTQMDTVGANHGYPCVATFTNPDGKDATDLGSVYTDTAGREYVLLAFDAGKLVIGGSYSTTGGAVTSGAVNPATNLVHVSGGTHTGTIDRTTRAAAQLAPSVGRSVVTLWCDGKPVGDGTTKGSEVVLRETYDILDYASIYDTAKAQPGTAIPERAIDAAVRVTVTWRWTGEGLCRVSTEYIEMKPTTLAVCGGLQAGVPQSGSTYPTRYLPGVGAVGANNWTTGVPMSTFTTTQIIPASAGVPAFSLDVLPAVAFAMGYLPHGVRGDEASRSGVRATKAAANVWDMRSTRKSYPTVTTSEAAGWGRLVIEGYRAYLTPTQAAQVLAAKGSAPAAYSTLATILGL